MRSLVLRLGLAGCLAAAAASAQEAPELYVVGTAHLDTQWRWTIERTIAEYIPATLRDNFRLFEKYPDYVFSFEGAFRYMLMKEYYPEEYEQLKRYIAAGRWRVAGSWLDAVDVNIPSPESLTRQALYGNGFFHRAFGVTSQDVYLPDCFGFGYALPSIAAHCGLTGFSSQKLTWGSAIRVPFDIGLWEGPDGATLVAALNPGEYVARIDHDLSADSAWAATIERQGATSGLYAGFKYFGTGDQGGAPTDESVAWLERSLRGAGPIHVRSTASDQLARDLTSGPAASLRERLPRYRGELLMTDHGTGCYTSQAAMKTWNRRNEHWADAAERASVIAHWLGGAAYPRETLQAAWQRFLVHQFHDDLTGTSIPEAYVFSWNDEQIALNEFRGVFEDAMAAISRGLDTRARSTPLVVFNPLSIPRTEVVEAAVVFDEKMSRSVRVYGPDGLEVPSQLLSISADTARVVFLANVGPVGCAVFEVRPTLARTEMVTDVTADETRLENARYRLRINAEGDIASIYDKHARRELLREPLRLELLTDSPLDWAAWELDYDDVMAAPRAVVAGPAQVRVIERGPVRGVLEVRRSAQGSTFIQQIRLGAGAAGNRIEIATEIDWRTPGTLLKAAFPLAVRDSVATYDLGLGTITRGVNASRLYEVPAQLWADLTAAQGDYGVAILNDGRYGWDRPDDHTLRLTLLHTPEVNERWNWIADQASQDLGHHRVTFAICGHGGDWRAGAVPWEAERLNQPLRVFQTTKHRGKLGEQFSLLRLSAPGIGDENPPVAVRAVKLAEESDEIVVRLQELTGHAVAGVRLEFASPIVSARELNGAEESLPARSDGSATLAAGVLEISFAPYQPRTFAVWLGNPPEQLTSATALPMALPYNLDGVSLDDDRSDGDFDGTGRTLPGELLPSTLVRAGIPFRMGSSAPGEMNVLTCRGQRLELSQGDYNRLYILAAAVGGDRVATFSLDDEAIDLWIQDFQEPIGQWDSRVAQGEFNSAPDAIAPGYIKPTPLAWVGTHSHAADGRNEPYQYVYAFRYAVDISRGAWVLDLPHDERIRIFAMTLANNPNESTRPAALFDDRPTRTLVKIHAAQREFVDSLSIALSSPNPHAVIRYTLDGLTPDPSSHSYGGPFTIRAAADLRARAFAPGMDDAYVAAAAFKRLTPREPEPLVDPQPGLVCRYYEYEGQWSRLPEFDTLTAQRVAVVPDVSLPPFARAERIGLLISGYVQVPTDGLYSFFLSSDDGSALRIGDEQVIDNDGLHGAQEKVGRVALRAGQHPFAVMFFQGSGDASLELELEGPGVPRQRIPAQMLFHAGRQP